jgi:hypothetical protein
MSKKAEKSEVEIVREYAMGIIKRQLSRGHADRNIETRNTTNKDLWMDTDFYFSVVFASAKQKYEFLEQFCEKFGIQLETSRDEKVSIINGIRLASNLKFKIPEEKTLDYPNGALDLRPYVLDNE